jgi:hypothetical protein
MTDFWPEVNLILGFNKFWIGSGNSKNFEMSIFFDGVPVSNL